MQPSHVRGVPEKWIENRVWEPPAGLRGQRIWIHESGPDGRGLIGSVRILGWHSSQYMPGIDIEEQVQQLPDVYQIFTVSMRKPSYEGLVYASRQDGMVWWLLSDPICFARPLPVKGKLNLWKVPDSLLESISQSDRQKLSARL